MGGSHGFGKLNNLAKIFSHHVPSIPVGIVGIDVEKSLVSAHTMFHVYTNQNLRFPSQG